MIRSEQLRIFYFLMLLMGWTSAGYSQISGGEIKTPKKEKEKKDRKDKEEKEEKEVFDASSLTGSSFYATGMLIHSYRGFEDHTNSKVYSDLESQEATLTFGGNAGIIIPLNKSFSLDLSVSGFGFGEKNDYSDDDSDSTYSYKNTYIHGAIPLKLRYTYGTDIQFFGFAGIAPGNIFDLRIKSDYTTSDGLEIENEVETANTDDYTPFTFTLSGGVGMNYYFNQIGFTVSTEYRRNLTNTYANNVLKRTHNLYGISLNMGLTYRF